MTVHARTRSTGVRHALGWVLAAPRDEWGERYLLAARAMRRFDVARGEVWHYLSRCWANARRDVLRRQRRRLDTVQHDDAIQVQDRRQPQEKPDTSRLRVGEAMMLVARGVTYEGIALALGIPKGTVKSRLHDERKRHRWEA